MQIFLEWVPGVGLVFSGIFYPFSSDSPGLISAINFEPHMENVQSQTIQLVFCFLYVALTKISCVAQFWMGGGLFCFPQSVKWLLRLWNLSEINVRLIEKSHSALMPESDS